MAPVPERRPDAIGCKSRAWAERLLDELENSQVLTAPRRIQSRTITTFSDGGTLISPWSDLPGEGESDDG